MDHNPFRTQGSQGTGNHGYQAPFQQQQGQQQQQQLPQQMPQPYNLSSQALQAFDPMYQQQQQQPQAQQQHGYSPYQQPQQQQPLNNAYVQPQSPYGFSPQVGYLQQQSQPYPALNTNLPPSVGGYSPMHTQQPFSMPQPQQPAQPQYRHPPIDASSLLKSTEVRKVDCPVCHKTIEGDAAAINFHVNDHY
ncbi:hypothetical protein BC940DRAFT_293176 [Gongronella butleri]|nr:hypothetical protein BC940DRAFT_293176 [Gongronella butleri]